MYAASRSTEALTTSVMAVSMRCSAASRDSAAIPGEPIGRRAGTGSMAAAGPPNPRRNGSARRSSSAGTTMPRAIWLRSRASYDAEHDGNRFSAST